jgi:hypothetical protein
MMFILEFLACFHKDHHFNNKSMLLLHGAQGKEEGAKAEIFLGIGLGVDPVCPGLQPER